jgi:hypothetical protein
MNAIVRALPLAIVSTAWVIAAAVESEPAPLPPIFLARAPVTPSATENGAVEIARHADALPADTWRGAVARKVAVLAAEKPFVGPLPAGAAPGKDDIVMMERFVVNTPPEHRVLPPPRENPILRAIETGILYRRVGPYRTTEAFYRFVPLTAPGTGAGREFTRAQVGLSISW